MSFVRHQGLLYAEGLALSELAARFGTPCYIYSLAAVRSAYQDYERALRFRPALICYAVKANANLSILREFVRWGAGFDIVSGGELARVMAAGGNPRQVVFSGVGKSSAEIEQALAADINCFNVESAGELHRLSAMAQARGQLAPIALRVNPHVDARTHPYIATGLATSKFGIAHDEALALYRLAQSLPGITIRGIACHIGSQLLDPAPTAQAAQRLAVLVRALAAEGIPLTQIDIGGGLGVRYGDEAVPSVADFLRPALEALADRTERLLVEPGRSLVAEAGILLTTVEYIKPHHERNFAIVDAAMNDLMRPALYGAWHDIVAVHTANAASPDEDLCPPYDIVGPVCESSDVLGSARHLQVTLRAGDLLAILGAGAYGMSMGSNYNSRPRPPEVLVDGQQARLIRPRERPDDLFACEADLL
jgi:diaminopimelate decarboxylase